MSDNEQIVKGWIEELVEKRLKDIFLDICGKQASGAFSSWDEMHRAFHVVVARLLKEELEKHENELREMLRKRLFEATEKLSVEWHVGKYY